MRDYSELREQRMAAHPPGVRAFFDAVTRPPLREIGVEGLRERGKKLAVMMAGEPVGSDQIARQDVTIEGPHGPIATRIFTPTAAAARPRGIYLHTHGGGYVMLGGLDTCDGLNARTALETGCIVVAPDFRLPPEHPFPVPLDDCFAAFNWTAAHAADLGGHSDRIAIGGGCTGGNFAAAVTLLVRDAGGPQVAAQYLHWTVFDTRCEYLSFYENSEGYTLSRDDCHFVYSQYLPKFEDRFDWRASPILASTLHGLPPTLIRTGAWDVLRDEGRAFRDRLRDAGVKVIYSEGEAEAHGQTPFTAAAVQEEMNRFLDRYVGAGSWEMHDA